MTPLNLFAAIPERLPDELFDTLLSGAAFRLERIVSHGHSTPPGQWYDQDENEWVLLLQGEAALQLEGQTDPITLRPGDHLLLPARCRHRVAWTATGTDTVWLALFFADTAL